eukprot:gene33819-43701_t
MDVEEECKASFQAISPKVIFRYHRKNLALLTLAIAMAAVGGFFVFDFVHYYFLSQYLDSFNTLALQTFGALTVGLRNNYLACQALSEEVALHCPTGSHWPNCSIREDKYVRIVSPLVKMGYLRDLAPVPILKNPPKDVDSFEAF